MRENRLSAAPDREFVRNSMNINDLILGIPARPSRFGTGRGRRRHDTVRQSDSQGFPYQELRESVLVWHATCNRRGQNPEQLPEREAGKSRD
jgi:hypothetical protein